MTPSELDEICCMGSPGGHVSQKNFTQIACMASQKWAIKYLLFVIFSVPVTSQSIIIWAFFNVLKTDFTTL